MRKLMTLASAIMMVAAVNASEVTTVAFSEARVNLPARVRFVKGEHYGFSVEAKDSVLAKSVRCTVKDGVLRMSFGGALKPGETKYDAKKGVYYYGVNEPMWTATSDEASEMVITVVSPEIPVLKTSSDYVAVTLKDVEAAGAGNSDLTLNK